MHLKLSSSNVKWLNVLQKTFKKLSLKLTVLHVYEVEQSRSPDMKLQGT